MPNSHSQYQGADSLKLFFAVCPLLAAVIAIYYARRPGFRGPCFPPGPPGLPILGNVFDIPSAEPWIAYKRLGEKYGDLVHIRVLTQDAIVLNSYDAIKDLFEQRSQDYSSRPSMPTHNMLDLSWGTVCLPYSDEWKIHRKIFQQTLRPERIAAYHSMQSIKTRQLLQNLYDHPADFENHFRTFSTAIAMAVTYGYHPGSRSDPMVTSLKELARIIDSILSLETSFVFAAFPFLMRIPPWFPGANCQRAAQVGRGLIDRWFTIPLQYVADSTVSGRAAHCIVGEALSHIGNGNRADAERITRGVAASALLAASDTTDSVLQVFVLAMMLFPDVQRRAQDEIRTVVGTERLPVIGDRPGLHYIEAILRETLRWHPIVPFSIVRSVTNDDVYRGYSFPKGTMLIPNVWAIAHDEARYPNASAFNPSRFFDDKGNLNHDTVSYAFGFGRRTCAGKALADASLWIAICSLLAVFSFETPVDETGRPIEIEPRFTSGLASHPEHFPVRISSRWDELKFGCMVRVEE